MLFVINGNSFIKVTLLKYPNPRRNGVLRVTEAENASQDSVQLAKTQKTLMQIIFSV